MILDLNPIDIVTPKLDEAPGGRGQPFLHDPNGVQIDLGGPVE